ncbi:unannotated protein [freshwater metagenome]|uniref:Unannotated protein n=1 Tax=freshwater metagenome TaxID=449393 RepID=A0A6J6GVI7_9ZZZZ
MIAFAGNLSTIEDPPTNTALKLLTSSFCNAVGTRDVKFAPVLIAFSNND